MQHYLTYYKLIELIKNNLPIKMKSFGHGDLSYFGEKNENTLYPLLFVTPLEFTYEQNSTQVNLSVIFGDIVNTDLTNQVDVISDMSLACRDFLSQIENEGGTFYDYFDIVVPVTSSTFLERFNDHIGGIVLNLNLIYLEDMNACDQYISPTPTPSITPTPSLTPSITPTPTPSIPTSCGIIVGGGFTDLDGNTRNRLVKLSDNGVDLTAFYTNLGTGFSGIVRSTSIQSDAKIVVGGFFTEFNNNTRRRLLRLNSDGTEDTSFYINLGMGFNNPVHSTLVQSDGKIIAGGQFTELNGNTRNSLVRLNQDGTEDTSFYTNLGTGFSNTFGNTVLFTTSLQSNGKIVVGGFFTDLDGNTRNRLVRLNSDGTEDTGFYTNLGTGFSGGAPTNVSTTLIQSDGKIIVGGSFTNLNGNTRNNLVRLNQNGTEDTSFYTNLGTGFNGGVSTTLIQSDGKILVGGGFTDLDGNTRNRLVRLNQDGTEDTSFYTNLGTGFNGAVTEIKIQSDGKIVIGGFFSGLDGNTRNAMVRLNQDGTEDTSFYTNLGTGFNSIVNSISLYCPLPPPILLQENNGELLQQNNDNILI